ncbi:MAG: hypothetical protein N2167_05290 [Flavobacteriales bacterium]|nr:hypothetical protein [Flavobacteriales bacterium]
MKKVFFAVVPVYLLFINAYTQQPRVRKNIPDLSQALTISLDSSESRYIRFTVTNQIWIRFNQSNPGTLIADIPKPYTFDIGIRRLRLQMIGQVSERFFVYFQFGINNFNNLSPRKLGDFFHDAVVEFTPWKRHITLGAGLTGWTGYSRYSSPAVASTMMYDAPIFEQGTNDANDQFLRKLSVYMKGKFGKMDYRIILSNPFLASTSPIFDPNISQYANFTSKGSSLQVGGYFQYQFLEEESNQLPYTVGTYHGKKNVLNVGAGFQYQPDAMWSLANGSDTVFHDMKIFAGDLFYDAPLGDKKDMALSIYLAYTNYNFGPGYLREVGIMNPGQAVDPALASLNGTGNAYPMIGTGHTVFAQAGWMMPPHWFKSKVFTMMPYAGVQTSLWERLIDPMVTVDSGINFLFEGHRYKISLNYQNRPIFDATSFQQIQRNSSVILHLQIAI